MMRHACAFPFLFLFVSVLVSGMSASDFSAEPFRAGVARAAVVDAGARGVNISRVTNVTLTDKLNAAELAALPEARDVAATDTLVRLSYDVTLDGRADAAAFERVAARASDDALASAANERSNMRAARVEALAAPPTRRATPKLPPPDPDAS
jgi:hypothetical protein